MTPVPFRALIVDDEPLARETVRMLLEDRTDVVAVGECPNGQAAVEAIRNDPPDLVFLDVQMPVLDGFGVIREVGADAMPLVVFVTAYNQYALRAFEARALDYLLKPFDDERFAQAVDHAVERLRQRAVGALSSRLVGLLQDMGAEMSAPAPAPTPAEPDYPARIMVKSGSTVTFVNVSEVSLIEAAGDYIVLHAGGGEHLLRETMRGILKRLDPAHFVRIHRSTIVRIGAIERIEPYFHGDYIVTLQGSKQLRLSRRYWEHVEQALDGRSPSR